MTFLKEQYDARTRPHPQLLGTLPTDRPLGENEEPPLGAHLVTPRLGFTHHGIYAGGGQVIHYGSFAESTRRRPVEQVPVARFAHRHSVWIRTDRDAAFNRKTVVYRARSRVGEDRYRLLSNNCEHFCEWCVHGENRSYQVERILNAWQWTMKKLLAFVATLLTANLAWSSAAHAQRMAATTLATGASFTMPASRSCGYAQSVQYDFSQHRTQPSYRRGHDDVFQDNVEQSPCARDDPDRGDPRSRCDRVCLLLSHGRGIRLVGGDAGTRLNRGTYSLMRSWHVRTRWSGP